ncbi:hypothetical protein RchiOBHm_Chr5g0060931 [Rosa chinensis]|uniref:Transmembrane protein n=1 Tax=Rosa chinensis TaxID=74649 RepID=A0A2P6QHS3_ROSCH|nr:hypothetical protein RchiOBHm_Chr5g0060931 [Rosa chinensis]
MPTPTISFSFIIYVTHHNLIAKCFPHNSQEFFKISNLDPQQHQPSLPTKPLLLALAFSLFDFVFSLFSLGSITYNVFHDYYCQPIKFILAIQFVKIMFLLVVLIAGLFLFLVVGGFEMIGLEMEYSSPYLVGLFVEMWAEIWGFAAQFSSWVWMSLLMGGGIGRVWHMW